MVAVHMVLGLEPGVMNGSPRSPTGHWKRSADLEVHPETADRPLVQWEFDTLEGGD